MKDNQAYQEERALRREIGHRLRVTAHELGYRSAQALADYLGANRAQVAAWFNALAFPPVKYMSKLAIERGVSLDWIYRGDGAALSNALYIRLVAAMDAEAPPPDVLPEPEPEADSVGSAYPLRKARAGVSRREKPKRANAA